MEILLSRLNSKLDLIPSVTDYSLLLSQVSLKYNLSIDALRKVIGTLTYKEIFEKFPL